MEEVVGMAREVISPRTGARCLARQIKFSTSTELKICHDDLPFFPYKMQLSQPVSGAGIARRYVLARENIAILEDSSGALNVTWFSDEAHLNLIFI
jgi:hypothetical protein